MPIFSSKESSTPSFLRGFNPSMPWCVLITTLILVSVELLLRSGLLQFNFTAGEHEVHVPRSIERPIIYGADPQMWMSQPLIGPHPKPNYEGIFRHGEHVNELRLNNFGFHDRDFTVDRREGEIRVAVIGPSVLAAHQVQVDETWTSIIEKNLNLRSPSPIRIMNFGVPSLSLPNARALLEHEVLSFSPDIVVLHYATGYLYESGFYRVEEYRGYALRYVEEAELEKLKQRVDSEVASFQFVPLKYSYLARLLCFARGRAPVLRNTLASAEDPVIGPPLEFIESMRDLARAKGADFYVIAVDRARRKLPKEKLDELGIKVVSDRYNFNMHDPTLYWDLKDLHFTVDGNARYGSAMTPVFRRWIKALDDT